MRMKNQRWFRTFTWIFILFTVYGCRSVYAASTPKPMVENVAVMAEARASLSYCANSQDGATALWLQLVELQVRVDDLVADIGDYYEDDTLYVTYVVMEKRLLESSALISGIKSKYPGCSGGFASDMANYISDAEQSWKAFKARR